MPYNTVLVKIIVEVELAPHLIEVIMHYENGCIMRDQTFLGTSNGSGSLLCYLPSFFFIFLMLVFFVVLGGCFFFKTAS